MKIKTFLIQRKISNLSNVSFAYVNKAKALRQVSTLELSFKAQPGAKAKLFMKLPTSYFCDPVRERG